ncbi:hypothetical protein QSJ19_01155 [Gordonia sp. ABSL11-1]|uniref:hypothetical protein n=1 Tax=Gordonia sp. ABSL11-1 TaxID=3053924 RepID=UPI00257316FE|nr:hypothetical protein [Gordonia sp. ABSL11-1]MDL9944210.1 hypothetical protein [Gordonia sp. ABSL11-1]
MTNPFAAAVERALPVAERTGPSSYELAVLRGLQILPTIYQGFGADQVITHRDGTVEHVPDPRIAQTERRRARNRMARRSRRINRLGAQR